jgi:hypothetical protein
MIFEQTIDIPLDRKLRLELDLPEAMPCGKTRLTLIPQIPDTMRMSETSLAKDWNSSEEDRAWADL